MGWKASTKNTKVGIKPIKVEIIWFCGIIIDMASENAKAIAEDREDLIREIEEKTEVFKKLCEKQRDLSCREDKLWDYIGSVLIYLY